MRIKTCLFILFVIIVSNVTSQNTTKPKYFSKALLTEIIYLPDSVLSYTKDLENAVWQKEEKVSYIYNSTGKVLNKTKYKWEDAMWELNSFKENIYNDSLLIEQTSYFWDWYYEEWVGENKKQHVYDSLGFLFQELQTVYNEDDFIWENDSLYTYYYRSDGQVKEKVDYCWFNSFNNWEKILRQVYDFDALGNKNSLTGYNWDYDLMIWQKKSQVLYYYDTVSKLHIDLWQTTNANNNLWVNDYKTSYSYANGLLYEVTGYDWIINGSDSLWIEDYKVSYTYNENLKKTEEKYYIFEWDLLIWEQVKLLENTYDEESRLLKSEIFIHKNNKWLAINKLIYAYQGYMLNSFRLNSNHLFSAYPNPATNNLFVKSNCICAKNKTFITIYNMQGQLVKHLQVDCSNDILNIDISDLNNGFYILKMNNGNGINSTNFAIQR